MPVSFGALRRPGFDDQPADDRSSATRSAWPSAAGTRPSGASTAVPTDSTVARPAASSPRPTSPGSWRSRRRRRPSWPAWSPSTTPSRTSRAPRPASRSSPARASTRAATTRPRSWSPRRPRASACCCGRCTRSPTGASTSRRSSAGRCASGSATYCFLLTLDRHEHDPAVGDALAELEATGFTVKRLGSYPAWRRRWLSATDGRGARPRPHRRVAGAGRCPACVAWSPLRGDRAPRRPRPGSTSSTRWPTVVAAADIVVRGRRAPGARSRWSTRWPRRSPACPRSPTITDVGWVKAPIAAHAAAVLPDPSAFVPGHPLAGTERSGLGQRRRLACSPAPPGRSSVDEPVALDRWLDGGPAACAASASRSCRSPATSTTARRRPHQPPALRPGRGCFAGRLDAAGRSPLSARVAAPALTRVVSTPDGARFGGELAAANRERGGGRIDRARRGRSTTPVERAAGRATPPAVGGARSPARAGGRARPAGDASTPALTERGLRRRSAGAGWPASSRSRRRRAA